MKGKNELPRPFKLKDVLGKFHFYPKVIDGIVSKPCVGAKPLTVGYAIFALRSFFNNNINYFKTAKLEGTISGVGDIKHSSQVMGIIEKMPIELINEIYNIFTHDLFDMPREEALTIKKEELTPESIDLLNFLLKIDYGKFPGTPLQKAVLVAFVITKNSACAQKGSESGNGEEEKKGEGEGEGEPMDLLKELGFSHSDPHNMEKDIEIIEKIKPNEFTDKTLSINDSNPSSYLNAIMDNETSRILEVENSIDNISQWSIKNKKKFKQDLKSKKKRLMQMSSMGQLPKVPIKDHLHPLFMYKLAKKQLHYKDRYIIDDEKQLSIVLIDDSGSMSSPNKIKWRNGILHNRLNAVHDGRSDLLLYFYEVDIHQTYIVNQESQVKPIPLYNKLKKHSPCGGGTDIQGCLIKAMKNSSEYIKKNKQISHDLPVNIIIVCDGQDTFNYSQAMEARKKVSDQTKMRFIVNGVIIGTKHNDLKKFCEDTGGKFIYK